MFTFLIETFVLGLKNLHLHKLRSFLTALGIIFGVAAVIIMVAIGEGAKLAALEQIRQLGAENVLVRSQPPPETNEASSRTQRVLEYGLKRVDLARIETLPNVRRVVPLRDTEQKVTRGDLRANAHAVGTTSDLFSVINLRLARGTYFTQTHVDEAHAVCVMGSHVASQLFPLRDPIGETIQVGTGGRSTVILTIIGVLEPTGLRSGSDAASMMLLDPDRAVYFPLTLAQLAFGDSVLKQQAGSMERKKIELTEIWLQAESIDNVEAVAGMAENIVNINQPRKRLDVDVKAPIQILRAAENTQRTFNFIMVAIAAFALVVGGIGIMNIMLATVTERTKEIGIRRALGARRRDITLQFLIETTVISLTGGLIGILIGTGLAKLLPWLVKKVGTGEYPTSVAEWSVIGSFVVSGMIGIGFGLYPAIMAARMNPIEALRHE